MSTVTPRLSVGLPVYNGEEYLRPALDAVLGQTYTDFELVISSNASTDSTDEICQEYAARDPRIRFFRQEHNIGAAPNHDYVFRQSRGELFKWVSSDDLYARDLFERCIALLDEHPEAVLAHAWGAAIDGDGNVTQALEYPLNTESPRPSERLRSMMLDGDTPGALCADDFYGVIRAEALRSVKPHGSYYHADYTFTAQLALLGTFVQVPDWLYFRRHHAGRLSLSDIQTACANLDPKRSDRRRNPAVRLVAEYLLSWFAAVGRAPLPVRERIACYGQILRWIASRVSRRLRGWYPAEPPATFGRVDGLTVRAVVAGQEAS